MSSTFPDAICSYCRDQAYCQEVPRGSPVEDLKNAAISGFSLASAWLRARVRPKLNAQAYPGKQGCQCKHQ